MMAGTGEEVSVAEEAMEEEEEEEVLGVDGE